MKFSQIVKDRNAFNSGGIDTLHIYGDLSMWRIDGVVYAMGGLEESPYTHLISIKDYLEQFDLSDRARINECGVLVLDGNPVGRDEVLTLHQDRLGMHNAYPNQKVST